jgi:hypothetical protein
MYPRRSGRTRHDSFAPLTARGDRRRASWRLLHARHRPRQPALREPIPLPATRRSERTRTSAGRCRRPSLRAGRRAVSSLRKAAARPPNALKSLLLPSALNRSARSCRSRWSRHPRCRLVHPTSFPTRRLSSGLASYRWRSVAELRRGSGDPRASVFGIAAYTYELTRSSLAGTRFSNVCASSSASRNSRRWRSRISDNGGMIAEPRHPRHERQQHAPSRVQHSSGSTFGPQTPVISR